MTVLFNTFETWNSPIATGIHGKVGFKSRQGKIIPKHPVYDYSDYTNAKITSSEQ
jgi:hypothetical protein